MTGKPNVLILFTDQQRHDTIHYAGYPHMITPNLDRLAAEGCLYTHAHTTNPVCMAARHDLLTSHSGKAHGIFANSDCPIKDYSLPTLPRIFSENGYRTAAIGKMHFHPPREHHGYNELHLMEEIPDCRQNDQYATYLKNQGLGHVQNLHGVRPLAYTIPQNAQMPAEHHGSAWVANRTIQWLEENGNHPFFLFASWIHPHPPFDLPKEYQGLYRSRLLPEPAPVSRQYPFQTASSEWNGDFDTPEEKRAIREAYFSCITQVDYHIGRILDYLEHRGDLDNTLILFTSDHGEMLQDKGFYTKELPYEGSVRIPFIVRYPDKVSPGSIKEDFVDLFDILPTCLDVCGLSYPREGAELAGESLFAETAGRDRQYQFSSYGTGAQRWVMCRDKKYKYVYHYNRGTEELYDCESDPQELNNLVGSSALPQEAYQRLRIKAVEYEEQWGPEEAVMNGSLIRLDGEAYHPNRCSKFPEWANEHFQYFDERIRERGEVFNAELKHALSGHTDRQPLQLLEQPEWVQAFQRHWRRFHD